MRKARRKWSGLALIRHFPQALLMSPEPVPDPPPPCGFCGGEPAVVIDGQGWCVDCFHERGSCCSGEPE